jgi:Ependymin
MTSNRLTQLAVLIVLSLCAPGLRTAAAQSTSGLMCSAPKQFETRVLLIGPPGSHTFNWSYDFTNRRQYFASLTETGAIASIIIQKFEPGGTFHQYQISPSGDCSYEELSGELQEFGVPDDFVSETDIMIGGSLAASRYAFAADNGYSEQESETDVFTKQQCIPIFTTHAQVIPRFRDSRRWFPQWGEGQKLVYEDVTPGIKNTSVFDIPADCTFVH